MLINANPVVYDTPQSSRNHHSDLLHPENDMDFDDSIVETIDAEEIFGTDCFLIALVCMSCLTDLLYLELIRNINDPEHPVLCHSLEK